MMRSISGVWILYTGKVFMLSSGMLKEPFLGEYNRYKSAILAIGDSWLVMSMIRWPAGVFCPWCGSRYNWFTESRQIWDCVECERQFSVRTGTWMEGSHVGLDKWLVSWLLYDYVRKSQDAIRDMDRWHGGRDRIYEARLRSSELAAEVGVTRKTARLIRERLRAASPPPHHATIGQGYPDYTDFDLVYLSGQGDFWPYDSGIIVEHIVVASKHPYWTGAEADTGVKTKH